MKSILNTLTKMNNAIGLATLCGAIATTATLRMIAAQALGGISKRNPMVVDELLKWMRQP